jgi:hypothetical protein
MGWQHDYLDVSGYGKQKGLFFNFLKKVEKIISVKILSLSHNLSLLSRRIACAWFERDRAEERQHTANDGSRWV